MPRLTPLTIRRPRLERWLQAYAQYPLRLILAPAGSGKTSLLLKYCAESERETVYYALPEGCDAQYVTGLLAEAMDGSPAHCREVVIDEVDNGTPDAVATLTRFVEEAPENVTLVYVSRSREMLDVQRLVARGIAGVCDAHRMAFDVEEARTLAEASGVAWTDLELRRLIEDTDGWAMAISSTIRTAAAETETIERAYQLWRTQSQRFLQEFMSAELERVPADCARTFWALYKGEAMPDSPSIRELEMRGLFVVDGQEMPRLYRPLLPIGPKAVPESPAQAFTPPLMASLFRSFEARIGGRDIPWVRRRDQQIVKYLLLKQNGTATRAELASVFWPETERHLAIQSVRTVCSTIRKAFAGVVGPANVDLYFRTAPDVHIDLANVVCDTRRFITHVNDGDSCFDRQDMAGAAMHYRAADKLYAGPLLQFEAPESWLASHAQVLQERHLLVLERLSEIALEELRHTEALQYAQRANALRPNHPSILTLLTRIASCRVESQATRSKKPASKQAQEQPQASGV